MHINFFLFFYLCVFRLCRAQPTKLLYSAQYYSTPVQTVETVWRHQIINTQGGVVHFRLYSTLWSEGGLGWGGVLSDRDGWLWPWHQFPVSLLPVPPAAPSPLLPGYQTTIAALWLSSQVESLQATTSLGLSRQWAQGPAGVRQHSRLSQRGPTHCSPWVSVHPVWPNALLTNAAFVRAEATVYDVLIRHTVVQYYRDGKKWFIGLFTLLLQNWYQIKFCYCSINAASAAFCSSPAFIWRDVWQRAHFFSEPERM